MQPAILSVGTANPANRYTQEDIYRYASRSSPFYQSERIRQIFMNSDIDYRHLYLDLDHTRFDETIDQMHERFTAGSLEIGNAAIRRCFENGGVKPQDIDLIIAVSCTGYLCPGLSALFGKELGLRSDVQRADILGMGCAGAMPGLQRAHDFVLAYPKKKALLVTVEICSACYYIDESLETVVGNAICADGAAALVVAMDADGGSPRIEGFHTHLEPDYIHTVGFTQANGRWKIILSKDIRDVAGGLARKLFESMFFNYSLSRHDISHWIVHSGGRKVIDSIRTEMNLPPEDLRHSSCVLRQFGNMSSPTVLFVLDEVMRQAHPLPGEYGAMLAMGPGLAIEGAILRW